MPNGRFVNAAAALALSVSAFSSVAAPATEVPNDVYDIRAGAYAFTNATIHLDADTTTSGALLIRDGRIVEAGADGVPAGYVEIDVTGLHLYPGFVDLDQHYGLEDPPDRKPFSFGQPETMAAETEGPYSANDAIKSHFRAAAHFKPDGEKAKTLRGLGFGAVLTYQHDGIARGSGALVLLGDDPNEAVVQPDAAALYSFDKGSSGQSYPISIMGSVALLRQTHLDAQWYAAQSPRNFTDLSLDGWLAQQSLPQIIQADGWQDVLRARAIADEFEFSYIYRVTGNEYQRAAKVADGADMIVPLDFPDAPNVDDPLDARNVALTELKHWELAPSNPALLDAAGARVALTARGAEKSFVDNVKKAIERDWSAAEALRALTETPAQMLDLGNDLGSLRSGRIANILIVENELFADDAKILENWVGGQRYHLADRTVDHRGTYTLNVGDAAHDLIIAGEPGKPDASIPNDDESTEEEESIKVDVTFDGDLIRLSYDDDGLLRLTGWKDGERWAGKGARADGEWVEWSAIKTADHAEDAADDESADETGADNDDAEPIGRVMTPFAAYGHHEAPQQENIVFRNVTAWTNEQDGIVEGVDVYVSGGRISQIGENLRVSEAREVDGSGMHLTPGIVDEHAHIALSGVNDVAVNSGMVRMRDAVDSEDVNIYRNLAGGVTAAQLLHGSANPVGGQSALIKMRWGKTPDEMLIEDADGFIKFALGENVKRSSNAQSIRYPQTRMGVEQVYRDAFTRAQDYERQWAAYNSLSRRQRDATSPPRRDLVMDTMVEILNEERFITCHSYVQSEINMLMHVAEDFDFRVNTFTHILEGYKVADKMAAHGAGGSTFSDWWNYKWEVLFAIPYNATLMTQAGVVSAINSDSGEMSRRLNQEAAKSVKYGGMSEEDALKLVTLNPATLLHLDDRMGSIREGKDADLVLWTAHPLSIEARPRMTLVDGIAYFDVDRDVQLRDMMQAERARLVAKAKGKSNGKGGGGGYRPGRIFECESITGYEYLVDTAH